MDITSRLPVWSSRWHATFSYLLGLMLLGMLVLQLYTYEELGQSIAVLLPFVISSAESKVVAALVVSTELAALCYVLPLYLSRLARHVGRAALLVISFVWSFLLISPLLQAQAGPYPIFGTKIPFMVGAFALLPAIAFVMLSGILIAMDIKAKHSS